MGEARLKTCVLYVSISNRILQNANESIIQKANQRLTKGQRLLRNVRRVTKGHKETLGSDGNVHYLDFVAISWVYTYANTYQIVHFKHVCLYGM